MRTAHLALAAALFLTAAPATAAVHFNLTGVVTSGSDNGYIYPGLEAPFGSAPYGVNLGTGEAFGTAMGRPFSLAITFDPSRGLRDDYADGRVYHGVDAGSPGAAAFTLNGVTYELGSYADTSAASGVEKFNGSTQDRLAGAFRSTRSRPSMSGAFTQFSGDLLFSLSLPTTTFDSLDFEEPFSWAGASADSYARLQITLQNTDGGPDRYVVGPPRTADLYLRFDTLTATADPPVPSGTPEPSTWAMMILGFGLVGATVRRRARTGAGPAMPPRSSAA